MKLLVGGDPEIFLKDTNTGKHVSAHNLVPGTKKEPHKVSKGAIQHDGVALEINIEPASTREEFAENISVVLDEAKKILPKHIEFDFSPVVTFDKDYFSKLPAAVKELGCDPDYSGITGERNRQPNRNSLGPSVCTGAGHLTLGWKDDGGSAFDEDHFWDCQQMSLRLNSYFQDTRMLWDLDDKRRYLYGHSAAFRPKTFGVEYRSLSNAWLAHKELWPWLFDSCKFVFDHAVSGNKIYPLSCLKAMKTSTIGLSKEYRQVQQFIHPPAKRKELINPDISSIFGVDKIPDLPKDFTPVEYPEVDLYYDRSGRPIKKIKEESYSSITTNKYQVNYTNFFTR